MSRKELLARVTLEQIIGVVREDSVEAAEAVADAYARNGIRILEDTLTTPDPFDLMAMLVERYAANDITIAAGTARSSNEAALARRAGAKALTSRHTDARAVEDAAGNDLACCAGA